VSEHPDKDFQREQLAKISAEQKDEEERPRPSKRKKQELPISTSEAAALVEKVCTVMCGLF
jgi:hypothetical protein